MRAVKECHTGVDKIILFMLQADHFDIIYTLLANDNDFLDKAVVLHVLLQQLANKNNNYQSQLKTLIITYYPERSILIQDLLKGDHACIQQNYRYLQSLGFIDKDQQAVMALLENEIHTIITLFKHGCLSLEDIRKYAREHNEIHTVITLFKHGCLSLE